MNIHSSCISLQRCLPISGIGLGIKLLATPMVLYNNGGLIINKKRLDTLLVSDIVSIGHDWLLNY